MMIHKIYHLIFKLWRKKRMVLFEELIRPEKSESILDVGGYPATWTSRPQLAKSIECLNIHSVSWDHEKWPNHQITTSVGDGCALHFPDHTFDIVYSNSVIEHVGDWQMQQAFAREALRVGRKIWIQTPALECPLEPHFMAPFVHWLPIFVRRRILRWFTPWGWMQKPNQATVDEVISHTRLLSKKQFTELFPGCTIHTERLFGILTKSYIAYRTEH